MKSLKCCCPRFVVTCAAGSLLCLFLMPQSATAQERDPRAGSPKSARPEYTESISAVQIETPPNPLRFLPPAFQDTEYGRQSHLGEADDPGRGYLHYDSPNQRYGHWYRPHAFGRGVAERCAPRPFRPRGFGNLFNEPTTCRRMDYHRYVMTVEHKSRYGPSYYSRLPDPRCTDYDHTDKSRPGCDACGKSKTKVWTLRGERRLQ